MSQLVNQTIAETKGLTTEEKVELSGMNYSQAEHYSPYSYMSYEEVLKIAERLTGKDCRLNTKIALCNLIKNR